MAVIGIQITQTKPCQKLTRARNCQKFTPTLPIFLNQLGCDCIAHVRASNQQGLARLKCTETLRCTINKSITFQHNRTEKVLNISQLANITFCQTFKIIFKNFAFLDVLEIFRNRKHGANSKTILSKPNLWHFCQI